MIGAAVFFFLFGAWCGYTASLAVVEKQLVEEYEEFYRSAYKQYEDE